MGARSWSRATEAREIIRKERGRWTCETPGELDKQGDRAELTPKEASGPTSTREDSDRREVAWAEIGHSAAIVRIRVYHRVLRFVNCRHL